MSVATIMTSSENNKKTQIKDLIFITEFYPCGVSEAFIENEIGILSENFVRIFIITTTPTDNPARQIPSNVTLIKLERPHRYYERFLAITNIMFWKELFKTSLNPRKIWFGLNFLGKSLMIKRTIRKTLKTYKIINPALYSYWFTEGACAISMIKKVQKKLSRAHRFDLYEYGNSFFFQPFQKQMLEKLDLVLPCSNQGTGYLKGKFPAFKTKIHTSYLGTFKPNRTIKKLSTAFCIVSCSAITETKRVEMIVHGISKFEEKHKINIKWAHIGSGTRETIVRELAKQKLKRTEYEFLGQLPNREVFKYYQNHSVNLLINLSSSEGLPVSMMEALSFGIPIIATDVGGVAEIVNNQTGILLSANPSYEEIASAIEKCQKMTTNEYQQLRNSCIQFWTENFKATKNYKEFMQFFYA